MLTERQAGGCMCERLMDAISRIAHLEEALARANAQNASLRKQLGKMRRTALEKPFGLSTPSGKQLVKPSAEEPQSEEERRRRSGGGRPGHKGHGWKKLGDPEETFELADPEECPHCHGHLERAAFGADEFRDIVVAHPVRAHVRRYVRRVWFCSHCRKPVRTGIPGVIPGCRYSNSVIARAATEFFLHGIPAGVVARTSGVGKNTLFGIFNRVGEIMKGVREQLLDLIRKAEIAQGDETSWRNDGVNGWAWVFIAGGVVVYICADTRGSVVAKEALAGFKGLFLSDRYAGYAFLEMRAFCLEHLRRDALKAGEDNPDSEECRAFAEAIVSVLKEAMGLRREFGNDPKAYRKAAIDVAKRLHRIVMSPARHPDVQKLQDVFRDARLQCWQWLVGPEVPAENNRSEREVRPLALARKCSHGSQSDRGAETRGVLMSILHTLKACGADPEERFEKALDAYAENPDADMFQALFEGIDMKTPKLPVEPLRKLPEEVTGQSMCDAG